VRVADYIADFVYKQGVRNVFMLSGTGSIYLDDAFAFHPEIRFFTARHEAAAVAMAEACAKLSGGIGVAVTTTGPGGTNAFSGVVESWVDSVPVFILSGQVESKYFSTELRSFGIQGFNIVEHVKKITKYSAVVLDSLTIRFHMEKALHMALTGRKGPVWLDVPSDVQAQEIDPAQLQSYQSQPINNDGVDWEKNIANALTTLLSAKQPLIVVGQGVRQARAIPEFLQLLDFLGIPVVATRLGQDILPDKHPLYFNLGGLMGHPQSSAITLNCDVVLSLGSSLATSFIGNHANYFAKNAKFIVVDIDTSEVYKPGLNIEHLISHDVGETIRLLNKRLHTSVIPQWSNWLTRCHRHRVAKIALRPNADNKKINSYNFMECLDAASDKHNIFVSDAGGTNYVAGQQLKFDKGQREVTSGAFYSMGMTLPMAIGAAVTKPESQILALTGDGSIELNIQELRTISQYQLNIKVFIINNGGYASIRDSQDAFCGGRYTDERNVLNFRKVADAFEIPFYILERCEMLYTEIRTILDKSGPALIEVVCDKNQKISKFQQEKLTL